MYFSAIVLVARDRAKLEGTAEAVREAGGEALLGQKHAAICREVNSGLAFLE